TITGVGTLELNENGSYTFTPVADYNGDVPVVTYTVTDGSGTDDTSTLKIEINAKDDSFTDASEEVSVDEDGSLTDNVLTGTSSVDGDVTVKGFTVDGDDTEYSPGDTATIRAQRERQLHVHASGGLQRRRASGDV
ncbi:cadherin-like domain-containing protein, partial [Vibrio crassostreae]|uniref:cadherin-like domain-containing protein n=1 Tax=Vibrio crassostreae TaxID=246167 RepID=UPI000ACD0758